MIPQFSESGSISHSTPKAEVSGGCVQMRGFRARAGLCSASDRSQVDIGTETRQGGPN
jgi:hypothetical protein